MTDDTFRDDVLKRLDHLEQEVARLQRMEPGRTCEAPPFQRNQVGPYTLKLAHPGFVHFVEGTMRIGFPHNRRLLCARLIDHKPAAQVFIYLTSPVKMVIGLAEIAPKQQGQPPINQRYPHEVNLQWQLPPRWPGVRLREDLGLAFRPRIGDTLFSLSDETAGQLLKQLKVMPVLTPDRLNKLRHQFPLVQNG